VNYHSIEVQPSPYSARFLINEKLRLARKHINKMSLDWSEKNAAVARYCIDEVLTTTRAYVFAGLISEVEALYVEFEISALTTRSYQRVVEAMQ